MSDLRRIADLTPLLRQMNGLKRIRRGRRERSLTEQAFAIGWFGLTNDHDPHVVATAVTARLLAATKVAALWPEHLMMHGVEPEEVPPVYEAAIRQAGESVDEALVDQLVENHDQHDEFFEANRRSDDRPKRNHQ